MRRSLVRLKIVRFALELTKSRPTETGPSADSPSVALTPLMRPAGPLESGYGI